MITGFETNNRYDIKNNIDQMVYIVTEDTDDYTRNAYRNLRPFVLRVTDCLGREIMTMQRPFRCTCCCFCCSCARQEVREQEWNRHLCLICPLQCGWSSPFHILHGMEISDPTIKNKTETGQWGGRKLSKDRISVFLYLFN